MKYVLKASWAYTNSRFSCENDKSFNQLVAVTVSLWVKGSLPTVFTEIVT